MSKKIRINHSKSPFKKLNKKNKEKDFINEDLNKKLQNIEQVINRTQKIIDEIETEEKQNKLLKMMYKEDVDENFVKTSMNINDSELNFLIQGLVSKGFVQFSSGDEIELTKNGVLHVKNEEC